MITVQEYGEVAEEVVVTSEDPLIETTSEVMPTVISLPDHDYNIYRANKKSKLFVAPEVSNDEHRNQDEQMEAVAQSVAAAAQEKEKQKRKRGGQTVISDSPSIVDLLFTIMCLLKATGKQYSAS